MSRQVARIGAGGFGEVYKAKWKFVTVAGEWGSRRKKRQTGVGLEIRLMCVKVEKDTRAVMREGGLVKCIGPRAGYRGCARVQEKGQSGVERL